jgi:hypothetical protein
MAPQNPKEFRELVENELQAKQARDQAQAEDLQRNKTALEAQIGLPEQIGRLTEQVRKLIKVAEGSEKTTRRLVRLTWVIAALTFALLLFTIALYKDSRTPIQSSNFQNHSSATEP